MSVVIILFESRFVSGPREREDGGVRDGRPTGMQSLTRICMACRVVREPAESRRCPRMVHGPNTSTVRLERCLFRPEGDVIAPSNAKKNYPRHFLPPPISAGTMPGRFLRMLPH